MITWSSELLTATMRRRPTQLCPGLGSNKKDRKPKKRTREFLFMRDISPYFTVSITAEWQNKYLGDVS
jgi:hypothetical protein